MFRKLLSAIRTIFDPFQRPSNTRPFLLIGIVQSIITIIIIVLGFKIFSYSADFVSAIFNQDELGYSRESRSAIVLLTNGSIKYNLKNDAVILPYAHFADSANVKAEYSHTAYKTYVYPSPKSPLVYIWILYLLVLMAHLYILILIRKILRKISMREFFARINFFHLRLIGTLSILCSLSHIILNKLLEFKIYNSGILDFESQYFGWKFGIIALIAAEIFIAGARIKEENDLTV